MKYATVKSMIIHRSHAVEISVEVSIKRGLPSFVIVGLADRRLKEAKDRVKSAIVNCNYKWPMGHIVVNLCPSNVPKDTTHLDCAIAIAILQADNQIVINSSIENYIFGELGLSGEIKSDEKLIPSVINCAGLDGRCMVPTNTIKGIPIEISYAEATTLDVLVNKLRNNACIKTTIKKQEKPPNHHFLYDEIIGQENAKRAIIISAAGGHNILLEGPPGVGKTMCAKALHELLPALSVDESLQVMNTQAMYSFDIQNWKTCPFRDPHHTISLNKLLGGGIKMTPGEISLASKGILFLDEFTEFSNQCREALRIPMQNRIIQLKNQNDECSYMADCLYVFAMNSCICGKLNSTSNQCKCTASELARYKKRISDAIWDRIDLNIIMNMSNNKNKSDTNGADAQLQVSKARQIQNQRYGESKNNANVSDYEFYRHAQIETNALNVAKRLRDSQLLSYRAENRILRVARTIADMRESDIVESIDVLEAMRYRRVRD